VGVRGKRSARAAFAAVTLVLAQVTGCSSCVDEPQPVLTGKERKPINLKAADKNFSLPQFSDAGAADATGD
jgi:hypothetical protein